MENDKIIHVFSGLGADERVFCRLDFSGFEVVFIRWITPEKREPIEHYARRLSGQITTPNPVLLGLSFGGIMAVEVAKLMATRKIILLSSAKNRWEIPFSYRLFGALKLHKCLPPRLLKTPNPLTDWFFGVQTPEDKALLAAILVDTDPVFLAWATDQIVRWANTQNPANCLHIHGEQDRILPLRHVRADIAIARGGHLMVLNQAGTLSEILAREIRE
ncbi:MAG: alpha/beta hydrolase [Zoogloeaceae bacterium]|jgi:pimeloyl-ACP methyl ester carboxylesterase|nr:alpha/beta hydrolase [Zoogloeaceae bacterium]